MQVLTQHATFLTHNGNAAGAVPQSNILAVTLIELHGLPVPGGHGRSGGAPDRHRVPLREHRPQRHRGPGLTTAVVRKFFMGRHNFQWLLCGANVMGRRTGPNAWTFHFQTVRVLGYDRYAALEAIRGFAQGEAPRPLHVNKFKSLAVHASGVV
ncbi:hypothetical protein [Hyalangium sp.]|uniref:hypothetical protein n=1 Tax=Hyalangium sp. TaxID=2028555 RepID=UPI002D3FE827|nr:hypothetical protein [Hyalangium sp.]HYI01206.1 hypothetical protein [Hyalangium sp.]